MYRKQNGHDFREGNSCQGFREITKTSLLHAVRYRLVVFLVENEILRKRRNILPLSYVVKKNMNQAKESYAISAAILMSDLAVIC